jgi:hypothetical protein
MSVLVYLSGLIVIVGVAIAIAAPLLWPRSSRPSARPTDPERYRLEKEKELAYAAIKEAEFDLQMGKLSPEDHATLREKYEGRALAALEALERRG